MEAAVLVERVIELDSKGMKVLMERRAQCISCPGSALPSISACIKTPVQLCRHLLVPAPIVISVIIPAHHPDINLARRRPSAVVVLGWEHHELREQPISRCELGDDLDAAIADDAKVLGRDPAGLDGRDDFSRGEVCDLNAVLGCCGGAGSVGCEVYLCCFGEEFVCL
ncbi:hypothetical protein LB505_011315 [Fusarium chuoi]|nr:hypothetical protein LB505_011315 [Fusarium chuoi]